jgi:prevent-host-death family protein
MDYIAMLTVNISDLRSNLLKYLEKANHGEQITVTTNGRILATIAPPTDKKAMAKKQLSELAASAKLHDVTSPLDAQWDAML